MCFFYNLEKLEPRYQKRGGPEIKFDRMDLVNGFTYPEMPVVSTSGLEKMHWGLIPFWSRDESIRQYTLNARAETLFQKPSFKNRIATHRCIIPTTGFFEWQHTGTKKQPWFIRLKKQDSFTFAGLWDRWTDASTGQTFQSFSIITTPANPLLAEIHNSKKRMPLVLTKDVEFEWPRKALSKNGIRNFLVPPGADIFEAWPVERFNRNAVRQENITRPLNL